MAFQLKCFELVLLQKAALPALQTLPKHTSHSTGQQQAKHGWHVLHKHLCQPQEKTRQGGKCQEEEKPSFWELC